MGNKEEFLSKTADHMLDLLKNDDHQSRSNGALLLLLILFLLTAIIHFVKFGFGPLLIISLAICALLLVFFRVKNSSAIKENSNYSNFDSYKDVDPITHLRTKLQYIHSGIEVKATRTQSLRIMYFLIFPCILLMLKDVFQGVAASTSGLVWSIIFAFLTGGIFWWFYFGREVEELEISQGDVEGYLEGI